MSIAIKDINEAFTIIVAGLEKAQAAGIYTLQESRTFADAIDYFLEVSKKNKDTNEISNGQSG